MSEDCPAQLRGVVDHGFVVVPEDVGGRLGGLPQVTVKDKLGSCLYKLLMSFFFLFCFKSLDGFVLNLDLSKSICNK